MTKRRAATTPWHVSEARTPGRRPKAKESRPACIWPTHEGSCGAPIQDGLAICPEHAKILRASAGHECAWPPCTQFAPYEALCCYHGKVARGLLTPAR